MLLDLAPRRKKPCGNWFLCAGRPKTKLVSALVMQGAWRLALLRVAFATALAISPTWLTFRLIFGENNGGPRFARWRPAVLGLTALVPLAAP
jgi:hypothetical protein